MIERFIAIRTQSKRSLYLIYTKENSCDNEVAKCTGSKFLKVILRIFKGANEW